MQNESTAPYISMLLGSLAFTIMGKLTHDLRLFCTWQVIALVRAALALVFAALLARAAGARLVFWKPRVLWFRSLVGSCSLVCCFYAMTRMPLPEVLTLTNTFPIWIALISWWWLGERPTAVLWLSLVSALLGVYLIQKPVFDRGDVTALFALAASFFTAAAMMGLNRLKHVDPRAIVVHFSGVAVLFCVVSLFLLPHDAAASEVDATATLLLLVGVGATATIGQLLLTRAFTMGVPSKVSVVGLTQVVFALALDTRVWRGELDAATMLGIVLILLPTAWLLLSRQTTDEKEVAPNVEPASRPEPVL